VPSSDDCDRAPCQLKDIVADRSQQQTANTPRPRDPVTTSEALADAVGQGQTKSQGNRLALDSHVGIVGLYAHYVLGERCLGGLPTFGKCFGDLPLLFGLHGMGVPGVQR